MYATTSTAAQAANRMRAQQAYRSVDQMQRSRPTTYSPGRYDTAVATAYYGAAPSQHNAYQAAYAQQRAYDDVSGGEQDYLDELEALGSLRARGILTDYEYDAKKRQILGV